MQLPNSFRERSPKSIALALLTVIGGLAILFLSYFLRERDHWWSDAAMTVGFALALVGPLIWVSKGIESRNEKKIDALRHDVAEEVEGLRRSLTESQDYVYGKLREQEKAERASLAAMLDDTSFETVRSSLESARDLRLLSPIGVRGDAIATEFYVRIRLVDDDVWMHLDGFAQTDVFSRKWEPSERLEDLMLNLAAEVKGTPWWPGEGRWNFVAAFEQIVDVFHTALSMRSNGEFVTNTVEKVGDEWMLSDWDAIGIGHNYQVTYDRLNETDWYEHLSNKGWTERANVATMLGHAEQLRRLAAELNNSTAG